LSNLQKLRAITTKQDKIFLLVLLFMSILLSLIETVGISAIMPFISVSSNPSQIDTNTYFKSVYTFFNFESKNNFIFAFGFILIGYYFARGAYGFLYSYVSNTFSFNVFYKFSSRLFEGYVNLPYDKFASRNSSTMIKTITSEASNLSNMIQNILLFMSEMFTVLFLYILILFVNLKMTLILTAILGLKVLFLTKKLSKIIKRQGEKRAAFQNKFHRLIAETFGNFKIIKLIGNESQILDSFAVSGKGLARNHIISNTLNQVPKNILETVGFSILIASVLFIIYKYNDASFVIPVITMYALAMYRMLPAINRMLISYNNILFWSKSLDIIYDDLIFEKESYGVEPVAFDEKIVLENISFGYDANHQVLTDISFVINKGDKIAFIGESGSGKSTLIDIIIGIYCPHSGSIKVDNQLINNSNIGSWRRKVGYIPQNIYLFDSTVAENVAFGKVFDEQRIISALKQANIYDFLAKKDGIYTKVGDGGIKLSGGQKQRIGIARALYGDPEILVLDEATSALDNETESKIMEEIYEAGKSKTMLVIAHRLSTIEKCDKILKVQDGKIESV